MFCYCDHGHHATCGVAGGVVVLCLVLQAVLLHRIWCHERCRRTAFGVTVAVVMLHMVSWVLLLDCMVLWLWSPCRMQP